MSGAKLKRVGLLVASYAAIVGLLLYRDFLCYQRIDASIAQITPTLLGNGMPQGQIDAMIFLLRSMATELRALTTSAFILLALISTVILVSQILRASKGSH